MTTKRFKLEDIGFVCDNGKLIGMKDIVAVMNDLQEENEQLKQQTKKLEAQLHCPFNSICTICNNEYLERKTVLHRNGEYYISKCKKGHKECSKTDVVCCEDFELKDGDDSK